MNSIRHLRVRCREAFWLVPTAFGTGALLLGLALPAIDGHPAFSVLYPGGPESARSFLSSITTAMISITAVVFSLTIVALQLAASQFSPRVMRDFLRDRLIQYTLGVFVATFTYSMVVQRAVHGTSAGSNEVPEFAVSVAFVLVLVSVAFLVAYIDHIANAIRVANIIDRIGAHTRETLEARYPVAGDPPANDPLPGRTSGEPVTSPRAGVVTSVNVDALLAAAVDADAIVIVSVRMGDFVPGGAPLFTVYGNGLKGARLLRHFSFDTERTYEQDVAFGFRELVDIAERALSPAVNDPTTAAQAIDVLHDLLRRLATRPAPVGWRLDTHSTPRLFIPPYEFGELLELAVEEIFRYGTSDVQVPRRLRHMLDDLHAVALPIHRSAVEQWSRTLATAVAEGGK